MNIAGIKHIPKSNMCYAYDENHLDIILQTAHNDIDKVEIIIGDPFLYNQVTKDNQIGWIWEARLKPFLVMEKRQSTDIFDYYFIRYYSESLRNKYVFILHSQGHVYLYGARGIKDLGEEATFVVDRTPMFSSNWDTSDEVFNLFMYFNYPYINAIDIFNAPKWASDITWYQIFPDRFYPGKNKAPNTLEFGSITKGIRNHQLFGGNIEGVMEKIPYLKRLGITGIYFTPLFLSPSAHKYDTENYLLIDPQFGTNDDFKKMVEECHRNNIKVILDAVFNHCGYKHGFFQDVLNKKRDSVYWDCFFMDDDFTESPFDENGNQKSDVMVKYKTFATTPYMPKLNTENKMVRDYLLSVTKYWMKTGIDGWRLDVSNEVSHDFWREFRKVVKEMNPQAYIFGENWDDSNAWLMGDQFDAVMNYELSHSIWQYFGTSERDPHTNAKEFKNQIVTLQVRYPENVASAMFNLIGSHDTMRILNRCGFNKNLVKLAYLFMFSYTGSPTIYYGDEIAMEGEHDPDNRRCMIWDERKQDLDMFNFIKKLISLRNAYPEFKHVYIKWHIFDDHLLGYQKDNLFFFINRNDVEKTINLPLEIQDKLLFDIWNNKKIQLKSLTLKAYEFYILKI